MDTSLPLAPATSAAVPSSTTSSLDSTTAHKTAQDFEAVFLSQVFENMFQGIGSDSVFGGGNGETVYRSLLLLQYSKVAAKSGGVGIADAVQREMLRSQEAT